MIITQELLYEMLCHIDRRTIKSLLGRQRLRFSFTDLAFYLYQSVLHLTQAKSYESLWSEAFAKGYQQGCTNFHENVVLASKLAVWLFKVHAAEDTELTILDSTLLPTKESHCITGKDWANGDVTTRKDKHKNEVHICGRKGFVRLNDKGKIVTGMLTNINFADNIITKQPIMYGLVGKTVLADNGFNSKAIRLRCQPLGVKLISPYRKVEKKELSEEQRLLYKKRWKIETVFQALKAVYGKFRLTLSGGYRKTLQQGLFFLTLLAFNLT